MSSPPLDTALPVGWYCMSVSVSGYGVYEKRELLSVRDAVRGYKRTAVWRRTFRVMFNGWMGGWVADIKNEGDSYFFGGQAFPTYLGAIVALEIELANQQ